MKKTKLFASMLIGFAVAFSACTNVNDPDDDKKPGEKTTIYSENFGTDLTGTTPTSGWPVVADYTLFKKEGKGAAAVAYTSEGGTVSVRGNQPSSAYTGASGTNNVLIAAGGGSLIIKNIATCGAKKLLLSFGSIVVADTLVVQYRVSGTTEWKPVVYKKDKSGWGLVENIEIALAAGVNTINLKFTAAKTQYGTRLDDISITTEDATSAAVVDKDNDDAPSGEVSLCGDTTTPVSTLLEDFSTVESNVDIQLAGWKIFKPKGDRNWQGKIFIPSGGGANENYAQASAHNGGTSTTQYEYWLVTPPLNLAQATSKTLAFKTAKSFWTATSSLKVFVLKCENGTTTRSEITSAYIAKQADTDNIFYPSGSIDLSAYSGTIYIGFQYIAMGGASNSTTFRVDDVMFNVTTTSINITSPAVTSIKIGEVYNYNITTNVVNPSGSTTITATGLPTWATFTNNGDGTAKITGTPTAEGSSTIKITATNNGKSVVQEYTLVSTTPPPTGSNLIINGGFEDWTAALPLAWDNATYNTGVVKETTIVHSGANSLKQISGGTALKIQQEVDVVEGKTYVISYWVLDNAPKAKSRMWSFWLAGTTSLADNLAELRPDTYSTDNAEWVKVEHTLVAPATATKFRFEVRTYRESTTSDGDPIYYDDFSISEKK